MDFVTHAVPGPNSFSYFVPFLLLPTALLIPPSILSHVQLCSLFLPVIYGCLFHAWFKMGCTDVISMDVALWSLNLLALQDPRRAFRSIQIRTESPTGKTHEDETPGKAAIIGPPPPANQYGSTHTRQDVWEESYPSELSKRVPWVLSLIVSIRLRDWKIGVSSHDKLQPSSRLSRASFLKHALAIILQGYIIMDTAGLYVETDPYFSRSNMSIDASFPHHPPSISSTLAMVRMLPPRLVRASVVAAQTYATVTLLFFIPTLPLLALNALGLLPDQWSPQAWAVFFGPVSAVARKGVRGLWGEWWHQEMRQMVSTPGRSLNRLLNISTSSILGYAVLTASSFLFSGIIHIGLVPPQPKYATLSANKIRLHIIAFFWVQILAFGVELLASKLSQRYLPAVRRTILAKIIAVTWTAAFLCYTLPILAVALRELGLWQVHPVPVSIWRGITGNGFEFCWSGYSLL